jgi:WD40-like Beta Propeller Repeat
MRGCDSTNMRRSRSALFLSGLLIVSALRSQVLPAQYQSANFQFGIRSDTLTIFPAVGKPIKIELPFRRWRNATFAPDGKSIYAINYTDQREENISKSEFNPMRVTVIPGSDGFLITSFAISSRQDKLIISGSRQDTNGRRCGIFAVPMPDGNVKQILASDCANRWTWDDLSLSPSGEQAVATVGSNANHDLHLELLDLLHGTTKPIGSDVYLGVWSPDGKWIAARKNSDRDKLFLIDAHDFTRRREVGAAHVLVPAWSPDSSYLLLWKECGFFPGLDSPATLEKLDIGTGVRTTIRSSHCQIYHGFTGWVN